MKIKRFIFLAVISILFLAGILMPANAGIYNGSSNNINPSVINSGGISVITSLNNALTSSAGEIGVSSFTSTSNYLFTGNLQAVSYPSVVTTFTATTGALKGEINLSWTAPGADGTAGTCSLYEIRYSSMVSGSPASSESSFWSYNSISYYSLIPPPVAYGTGQSMTITGLTYGTTYYFALKSRNSVYSWAFLSKGATACAMRNVSPSAIIDLSASPQSDGSVILSWSAPGSDYWAGKLSTGTYRIDYSSYVKTWDKNNYQISITTHDVNPFDSQRWTITGLYGGSNYYFRLWTADETLNWSPLSNGATCQATQVLSIQADVNSYDFGTIIPSSSSITVSAINITNTGNIRQTYRLSIVSEPNSTWNSVTAAAPGAEEYRFSGILRTAAPVSGDFSSSDSFSVLKYRNGSATDLSKDTDPDNEKGFNVPVGITRKLWFKFESPVFTEITTVQSVPIRIIAIP